MNKRICILFWVCVLGLLLPTAVSHTLLAASQPSPVELVSDVDIEGPFTAVAGTVYTFTATASPNVPPITYVWQVDGQVITHTTGNVDTLAVNWTGVGQQPITVTASNDDREVTAVHIVTVLPPASHTDGFTDVYAAPRPGRALVSSANGSIFGPYSCTDFGDPFSPLNNPYIPGPHTYRYRIQIPANYPYDVVRVELFDSDSMNRASPTSPLTIYRTQAAIDAGLSPTTTTTTSPCGNRKDACLIPTGELYLVDSGVLALEEVNPYWHWRIDENRGAGSPPGNGSCGQPSSYNPLFNTDTRYALYYYQTSGGERVDLAVYTGQTGDGARDNGDHDADMRWVSPGAAPSYDQPVFVPADADFPGDFEIDLSSETPGIAVDPITGDRMIYLDITSLSGATENGFELWAGPPVYTATVPSDVNLRNVYLLDNPTGHNAFGVTIYALDYRPTNSNFARVYGLPLANFPPSLAGSQVTVALFDSDSGAQPPITFYFDTIPESEWAMTFAVQGVPDPDGQVRICIPGGCNNWWVQPPYQLTLPANFPGGRLMARYRTGFGDTHAWEVKLHPEPTSLSLSGPVTGTAGLPYDFQAAVFNPTIVEPLTYTWQATDLPTQVQTGYLSSDTTFNWAYGGVKTVMVTAVNRYGAVTATHQIPIIGPFAPIPVVELDGRYDAVKGIPYTFTAVAQPTATLPIQYIWQADGQTITHTGGLSDTLTFAWDSLGLQPITVTAVNVFGSAVDGRIVNILPSRNNTPFMFGGTGAAYPQSSANLALVKTASASVFGQNICTDYGDAYSPLASPWAPGPYTFDYLIQIPADYPFDTVRVEIFDPDSMNQAANNFTIARTDIAVSQGLSPTVTTACSGTEALQKNPCKLDTGEYNLVLSGTLDAEQVNPLWLVRVDENRGAGAAPGNGTCGEPAAYNESFNTRTLFDLYYWRDTEEYPTYQALARYTGQVGGARDGGDHDTDLRWVSPGAAQSYDQPTNVPVDPGSPGNFEIDLTSEVPNIIVDPATGDRYLNLGITAQDGASENSFQIWAGPPDYVSSIPSQANARNLYLLNNPAAHNPYGVTVYARDTFVQNWNHTSQFGDTPAVYFGPEVAGETVYVSLFDSDTGAQPPITFFADSIPEDEWSLTFAVSGQPDPDGQVRNCVPGSCNNTWVSPPYAVQLPENYPGGRLMIHYNGGEHDTATWRMAGGGRVWVDGPVTGTTNVTYTFTADASYFAYLDPITYTWEIAGQPPIIHVGDITDTIQLSWPTDGPKQITVTAASHYFFTGLSVVGQIVGTHQINIEESPATAPTNITFTGPDVSLVGEPVTITAVLAPPTSTLPITYTWQADDQPPVTQSGGIMDTAVYSWTTAGPKTITVTAENVAGSVTAVHTILIEQLQPDLTIIGLPQLITPLPVGAGLLVSFTVTISNAGDADVDSVFFVDVYINPTTILSTGIPLTQSSGFTAVPALAAGESLTVTINAPAGFADQPLTHTVYAMVDSTEAIAESVETNNVSGPLIVTDVHPLLNGVTIFGPPLGLTGETYTFTAVVAPSTIADPITYTWLVDSAPVLTMTNGTAVPITLTWPVTGSFDLLVIATHGFNTVTDTHTIVITDTPITDLAVIGAPHLLTPGPILPDQPVNFTVTIQNVGNTPITDHFFVDLFIDPAVVLSTSIPLTYSVGYMVVSGLDVGETAVLTYSLPAGFGPGPLVRQVYAMVDSLQTIPEAVETNNISLPLEVVVGWPLYLPVVLKP